MPTNTDAWTHAVLGGLAWYDAQEHDVVEADGQCDRFVGGHDVKGRAANEATCGSADKRNRLCREENRTKISRIMRSLDRAIPPLLAACERA